MGSILTILRGTMRQSKDGVAWVTGDNPVIFERPYPSASGYVFDADSREATVYVKPGSRTTTGLIVVSSADTDEGFYQVEGITDDFSEFGTSSGHTQLIQRGTLVLVDGENTVALPLSYANNTYSVDPVGGESFATLKAGSKTTTSFVVISPGGDTNFTWLTVGEV
jgi:hypothetical protein